MFTAGDLIDGLYLVQGLCSNEGGMGTILFVKRQVEPQTPQLVLKYCKQAEDQALRRFRREVRLLDSFQHNSKIAQIIDKNLDHDPPYFVMRYYPEGDLRGKSAVLQQSLVEQERCFLQIIDCIQELHSKNEYHRDIKPQNFLVDGDQIVVCDFGLATETGSATAFTTTTMAWGTQGYAPPEFVAVPGAFKAADATSDIFMIGKTIYVLMTGRDPMYILPDQLPSPLLHVIERCCALAKSQRYQTLSDLKQALVSAYDVLLGRGGGLAKAKQLLSTLDDWKAQNGTYVPAQVIEFVEQLAVLDEPEQIQLCREIPQWFYGVIGQPPVQQATPVFLAAYERLVNSQAYGWSYAETIAGNMQLLFNSQASNEHKTKALELAIRAAHYMHRFAAMGTCRSMITSIHDESLGFRVASMLQLYGHTFVAEMEPSALSSDSVRAAVKLIQATSN